MFDPDAVLRDKQVAVFAAGEHADATFAAELEAEFEELGFSADVTAIGIDEYDLREQVLHHTGLEAEVPLWFVVITVAGTTLLQLIASDAYTGLKRVAALAWQRLRASDDSEHEGGIIITDHESSIHVVLAPDIPPEAFRELVPYLQDSAEAALYWNGHSWVRTALTEDDLDF